MAKSFFESLTASKEVFERASDVMGISFRDLIFDSSMEELSLTKNSQPAIFVASIAILEGLKSQFPDLTFSMAGGLSLGEYSALCGAGKLDFDDALRLVSLRGEFMQRSSDEQPGSMVAALGVDEAEVKEILRGFEGAWIANLNCPGQVVIAHRKSAAEALEAKLKSGGCRKVIALPVSGAFHSPLMQGAQHELEQLLQTVQVCESEIRTVLNVPGDFVDDSASILSDLGRQVVESVRWEDCIRAMDREGAKLYLSVGPGKSLLGMNKKIGPQGKTLKVEEMEDLEEVGREI